MHMIMSNLFNFISRWHLSVKCAVCKKLVNNEIIFKGSDKID